MRVRETKYENAEQVLANVEWLGGAYEAWDKGKLNPKDMPDETSKHLADSVDTWFALAMDRYRKLEDHLKRERDRESVAVV